MRMLIGLSEETDVLTKKKNHLKQLGLFFFIILFSVLISSVQSWREAEESQAKWQENEHRNRRHFNLWREPWTAGTIVKAGSIFMDGNELARTFHNRLWYIIIVIIIIDL